MSQRPFMKADHQPTPADAGDPAMLLGDWINTQPGTNSLTRVSLRESLGRTYLRVFGAGRAEPVDWGEQEIQVNLAGRQQTGFYTTYRLDGVDVSLAANCKLGVLVILSMSSFRDGSGRAGYMERGFFCREQMLPLSSPAKNPGSGSEPIDLSSFAGSWRNTDSQPKWLESIQIGRGAPGWLLSGQALTEPTCLEETPLTSYMDNMGYLAFKAEYRYADRLVVLAANTQKELIVLTSFHRLGPGCDDRNRVYREFFYRIPNVSETP